MIDFFYNTNKFSVQGKVLKLFVLNRIFLNDRRFSVTLQMSHINTVVNYGNRLSFWFSLYSTGDRSPRGPLVRQAINSDPSILGRRTNFKMAHRRETSNMLTTPVLFLCLLIKIPLLILIYYSLRFAAQNGMINERVG